MLKSLYINNIAVIEKTSIDLTEGFNVLTGETGSGKSIIIDSLSAVLGSRTSRDLVRTGADSAEVIAQFCDIGETVKNKLIDLDMYDGEDALVIQRKITSDGRSTCRINGKPVTAAMTKEIANLLVNIHGQRDNGELLKSENHYKFVDRLMGDEKLLGDYKSAYKKLCDTIRALREIDTDESEKEKLVEKLSYQIDEIEKAQISVGELEELLKRREVINNATEVVGTLKQGLFCISGDDENNGATSLVGTATRILSQCSDIEEIGEIADKLGECAGTLENVSELINERLEDYDIIPGEIDKIEDRLSVINSLTRKYGSTEQDVLDYLEECKSRLKNIRFSDERREMLENEFELRKETAYNLALELSEKRSKTAEILEKNIKKELEFLNMPGAVFKVDRKDGPMCSAGIDKIEFMISLNVGEQLKPLTNVASGGELSRIMLAIKSVIGSHDTTDTLIFDEIDSGVSGRAARKIGIKLKEISNHAQVICITHLAQIACLADSHFLIEKSQDGSRTYTTVNSLDTQGRVYELARIMGGSKETKELLESAKQMLALD